MSIRNIRRLMPSALAAACVLGISMQAFGAGLNAATSGYLTIQPNGTNTGFLYTFSWVAPDTNNAADGATWTDTRFTNPFGNGNARLDDVDNLYGGNYTLGTGQQIYYAWGMSSGNGYESDNVPANTATQVGYQDPLDLTVGVSGPAAATPKFDTTGNWTNRNAIAVASGVQGVTGVFSTDPTGAGATTGQGVGFWIDTDGADDATGTDDFGVILAGYDYVLDPTNNNPMPNTGFVQVNVPYPTTGFSGTPWDGFYEGVYTKNSSVEITVINDSSYAPKLAVSGDFDSDFDIDNADIGKVTGSFTGAGGSGKWYADGDTDADGDVDNADIGKVTGGFTGALAGNLTDTAGIPDLIYDPATGNVTVDTEGKAITSFQFENGGAGTFVPGAYISPADFPNNLFNSPIGQNFQQVTVNVIGDSDPALVGFTGTHNFGNIFPTGLDLAGLEAYLSTAVWGTFGDDSGDFDLVVNGAAVPTPAALPAAFGLIGLLVARRRRAA